MLDTTEKYLKTLTSKNILKIVSNCVYLKLTSNFMYLKLTSKKEISNIIANLDSNKSSGPDQIPGRLITPSVDNLCGFLANIINLTPGVSHNILKTATDIPVHKKKEKRFVRNYRHISLISICGKIFEKNYMHT